MKQIKIPILRCMCRLPRSRLPINTIKNEYLKLNYNLIFQNINKIIKLYTPKIIIFD